MNVDLLFSVLIFCLQLSLNIAKTVRHTFDITYTSGSYDGVWKEKVLTINRRFPGPTIRARVGDTLKIKVINSIQDGQNATIHWHGIHQRGTLDMDGPGMISQCPVKSGSDMTYTFKVEEQGTYWYHGHIKSQYTEGLWGILIVDNTKEVYTYHGEFSIALSDWYYKTGHQNEEWYLSPASNGIPPYPDSIMMNGKGVYPCVIARTLNRRCSTSSQIRPVFNLRTDRTYRVRVINTSGRSAFNFSIDGHTLQPIEVDGVDIDPTQSIRAIADIAQISSGQRYSFLIRKKFNWGWTRFSIRAVLLPLVLDSRSENINPRPDATKEEVTATIIYRRFFIRETAEKTNDNEMEIVEEATEPVVSTPSISNLLSDESNFISKIPTLGGASLESTVSEIPSVLSQISNPTLLDESLLRPYDRRLAPPSFDIEFVLNTDFVITPDGVRRPVFNSRPFRLPEDKPILHKVIDGDKLPEDLNLLTIPEYGSVVQIVINNVRAEHPIHLHGHTFWIMGKGKGTYNPQNQEHQLRIRRDGPRRDTVVLEPNSWTVLRFIADNPGVWGFHCHIDWHNIAGMAVNIVEAPKALRNIFALSEESKRVCRQ